MDAGIVLLQQGRVAVAPGKWKEQFLGQLANFKEKHNERTGNKKYEEGDEEEEEVTADLTSSTTPDTEISSEVGHSQCRI